MLTSTFVLSELLPRISPRFTNMKDKLGQIVQKPVTYWVTLKFRVNFPAVCI